MKRTIAVLAVGALLVGGATTALAEEAGPTGLTRCDEGHWPRTVQGRPAGFFEGRLGRSGYYLWHDERGWHLRTTTPSHESHTFTGIITSDDDIKVVHVYRGEPNDVVAVHGNIIEFRFDTHAHVDGVDFLVGCTDSLSFDLKAEGQQWPAGRIALGRRGSAPANPFTVHRV